MKFVGVLVISLLILAFALPAYAETQSVKVSGDLSTYAITRSNFDLDDNRETSAENPWLGMSQEDFIMSVVELQVDADLTDNVSTVIRIVNQRNWGDSDRKENFHQNDHSNYLITGHSLLDLGVDLAYVQIKELIFEPVSIRIGRQDLWFGRGMVIGANLVDPGYTGTSIPNEMAGEQWGVGAPNIPRTDLSTRQG